ncbi:MAG: nicotinate-nucleotide adenylyltransferase [Hungatella sp.]
MGKIGIMGGTFDPIHNGHLLIGRQALLEYDLDAVWYMPSGKPPHKKDHKVSTVKDRCAMVKLAILDEAHFIFSDFEASRHGNTYTAQTLALLRKDYPEHEFYFIIGADSLYEIETWYHPEEVLSQATLLVAGRDYEATHLPIDQQIQYLMKKYHTTIFLLHCDEFDISSEELRSMIKRGKSIIKYVPEPVAAYMEEHHLYQEEMEDGSSDS